MNRYDPRQNNNTLSDQGGQPFVINIDKATIQNDTFRTVLWTGDHLQLTLMSINVREDIGLSSIPIWINSYGSSVDRGL